MMEGVRDLDEIFAFYHHEECVRFSAPAMVRFLELVADVLKTKKLYYSTSHARLGLSRYATFAESSRHPSICICADESRYSLVYYECWEDGPFVRTRQDSISCDLEHARAALLEVLARLNPDYAEQPAVERPRSSK
jgi:hypothetical protein